MEEAAQASVSAGDVGKIPSLEESALPIAEEAGEGNVTTSKMRQEQRDARVHKAVGLGRLALEATRNMIQLMTSRECP